MDTSNSRLNHRTVRVGSTLSSTWKSRFDFGTVYAHMEM